MEVSSAPSRSSESTFITAKQLQNELKICDIIEFNRVHYSHFALHIGGGVCVHVTGPDEGGSLFQSKSTRTTCSLKERPSPGSKVAEHLLTIANKSRVRINNSELTAYQLGVKERETQVAISLALEGLPTDAQGAPLLGHPIPVNYSVVSSDNCEGWATFWKYEHKSGWSIQAGNGLIHATIGTMERLSEGVVALAEDTLEDSEAHVGWKAMAMSVVVPYCGVKLAARGVKTATDFGVASIMKLFD
jgi:hypothetical protein